MNHRLTLLKTAVGAASVAFAVCATNAFAQNDAAPSGSSETVGQHMDDSQITTRAKADLLGTKDLKSTDIHVKTHKGTVSLTGTVPTAEERDMAADVVKKISGVRSVKNHLKVVPA